MATKAVTLGAVCLLLVGFSAAQFRPSPQFRRPQQQQFRPQQQFRGRPQQAPVRQGRVIPQQQARPFTNSIPRPSNNQRPDSIPTTFTRPAQSRPAPISSSSNNSPPRGGRVITIPLPKDASGNDVYPDCNKGKVCLPVAEQCAIRKEKIGATPFQNKTYWFNWQSNEQVLREGKWNWFTARNYCRKRCMDLVSFESEEEWKLVKSFMDGAGIKEIWTSGRLCDAEVSGCDADHYKPLNINGWFWASTLVKMLPTNRPIGLNPDGVRVIGVNEWAKTGDKGKPQPDGFTPEGGLGEEPCMAVIDGKWHDTSCHNRRAIVCEDLPDQNIQFVRNQNPNVRIP